MSQLRQLSVPPDLLAVHRNHSERWPYLLQSASRAGALGRWSLLLRADPDQPAIVAGPEDAQRFLPRLRRAWHDSRQPQPGHLPFEGGWFIYLGYELAGAIEPRLRLPPASDGLPVALAVRCNAALVIDHHRSRSWLVAENEALMKAALNESTAAPLAPVSVFPDFPQVAADDGQRFMRGVERIRQYILDGDVFQVNLSRLWQGQTPHPPDPVLIYQSLSERNPAPFAGLARLPGGTLLSSSPERLVKAGGGRVAVRPIAGTRPRGDSPDRDRELSSELLANPKERAEHIMLIDLERNDLGRICRAGTVTVDELMIVESYAHVHHIVSNVRGVLRSDATPAEIIAAAFPGGTITGCPKVRCMEIIAELEQGGRSFYTGSMGYMGLNGTMDLNILIRSMLIQDNGIRFRTGAGIVADSDPRAELAETEAKAQGLMRALGHG